jgi:hypothetical protein
MEMEGVAGPAGWMQVVLQVQGFGGILANLLIDLNGR